MSQVLLKCPALTTTKSDCDGCQNSPLRLGLCYRRDILRRCRRWYASFRRFSYEDLVKRDKANMDIFWLRDDSMEDSANLPPPDQIAEEIVEDLRAALEQLEEIAADLSSETISGL